MRAAFSPIVRESGDISAGIFDLRGRMMAQAVTGTPGHINTMAASVKHFIARFPTETMAEGDIYVTNDPWLGSGHLNDFVLVKPCFLDGRAVGLNACTSHLADVGGRSFGPDAADVHEEGLYIPPVRLLERGRINETLMTLLRANSRVPVQNEGDLHALIACCEVGQERLVAMMREFAMTSLDHLAGHIAATSLEATRARIRDWPDGALEQRDDGRRLRFRDQDRRRTDDRRRQPPGRLRRQFGSVAPRHQLSPHLFPGPTRCSALNASSPPTSPTTRARSNPSPSRRQRARS